MKGCRRLFVLKSLLVMVGGFLVVSSVFAAEKLRIGFVVPIDSPDARFMELYITEACRRTGCEVDIEYYPLKRASILANNGELDGEVERVMDYNEEYSNLIRLEASTRTYRFMAFAYDPSVTLEGEGWETLRDTSYTVEYQRGVKKSEEMLTKLVAPKNLSGVDTVEQGLEKLIRGRSQVFISFEHWVREALQKSQFQGYELNQSWLMQEMPLHTFLHKKHKELAVKLSKTVSQMKAEGLIDEYLTKAFGQKWHSQTQPFE